jgi:hypothetical protein
VGAPGGFDIGAQPNGLGLAPLAHFGKAEAVELVDDALDAVGGADDQNANDLSPRLGGGFDGDLQCRVSQGRGDECLGHGRLLCCSMDHNIAPISGM